ncbi:pentapeptide repeat-containing protein, partial [Burkholderia sp. Bp8986]|uniref:pentapeptide repeat-containing protein n=1 Tax=Burkholderia sp. Bp8986 TaxID=2184550 RepID=UPI000FC1AF2F
TSARFDRCHFNDFSFEHAILENAQIADCYMYRVHFGYADARDARFSRINMIMPEGVARPDRRCRIGEFHLSFAEAILNNAVFEWCDLEGAPFAPIRGMNVTIADCHLYAASFDWNRVNVINRMSVQSTQTLAGIYQRCTGMSPPQAPVALRSAQNLPAKPATRAINLPTDVSNAAPSHRVS